MSYLCRLCAAFFIFFEGSGNFLKTILSCVGFASSLTKLWFERWLVGLWQSACKKGWHHSLFNKFFNRLNIKLSIAVSTFSFVGISSIHLKIPKAPNAIETIKNV